MGATVQRSRCWACAVAVIALTVSGCGSDGEANDDRDTTTTISAADSASTATSADTSFPVVLETERGDVVIESAPVRIVALGFAYADALVSLGVEPIAVFTGTGDFSSSPWLNGELPEASIDDRLMSADSPNIEHIASLEPDLILGYSWNITEGSVYGRLTDIAPTYTGHSSNDSWDVRLADVAAAVGLADRVADVVASVDAQYRAVTDVLPEFDSRTYQFLNFGEQGFCYGNGFWLQQFGFAPLNGAEQDIQSLDNCFSFEFVDQITADLVVVWPYPAGQRDVLESDPRFDALKSVQTDLFVWADDMLANATNSAGPLSLGYVIDQVAPVLELGVPNL